MIAVSSLLLHMLENQLTSNFVDLLCCVLEHLIPFLLVIFNSHRLGLCLLLGVLLRCLDFVHDECEWYKVREGNGYIVLRGSNRVEVGS